ncbi:SDR family NAD(P)-dependent oxidoreductase [Sandaracinobacteroides saxicola]|uniref:SDR family NAD(P)-dependent oxidoreductase n=1 Tax=Sandaracinobacteroides saxicola TaxID=2759707 RepID=A0A7G5ILE5_9SPHN|nr:SDR family NAD(P)-dependent oxidoreductase [Sandaracinobacteroides saxicola]QMW24187.1 SDR family NAD(P)-dependent oxidoreductase [Sandaracinobacteroides saxicola]
MAAFVVTGASTGIGAAIAQALVQAGHQVFGSVRRAADGERLHGALGDRFTPLLFDITDEGAVATAAAQVSAALDGGTLAGLVNNAGMAVSGPLIHQPIAEVRRQLEINVVGQLIVTQAFAPLLGADRTRVGPPGRIVMMGSESGKIGAPFVGAYCASKHALEGLSESLRRELMIFGIDVTLVGPGFVATPIWDKAEQIDIARYAATAFAPALHKTRDYMLAEGRKGHPPERIAAAVLHALTSPRPPVRQAVVKGWLMNWVLPLALPKRWVDRMIAGQLGLLPGR